MSFVSEDEDVEEVVPKKDDDLEDDEDDEHNNNDNGGEASKDNEGNDNASGDAEDPEPKMSPIKVGISFSILHDRVLLTCVLLRFTAFVLTCNSHRHNNRKQVWNDDR